MLVDVIEMCCVIDVNFWVMIMSVGDDGFVVLYYVVLFDVVRDDFMIVGYVG